MNLPPDWIPPKKWIPAPPDYTPVKYGSAFPPIQKLASGLLAIDQCRRGDGGYDIKVFDNKDHPNINKLPSNAPRAVRQLYKKEYQLRVLRATDGWGISNDVNAANEAWALYWVNTP